MGPFIRITAPRGRRGSGDSRIAIPEIAGNFDDLARAADWLPFGTKRPANGVSITDVEPRPAQLSWLVARAVSLRAF